MEELPRKPADSRSQHEPGRTVEPVRHDFSTLARGGKEVLIEYRGQLYRLRLTRNGKLILNK